MTVLLYRTNRDEPVGRNHLGLYTRGIQRVCFKDNYVHKCLPRGGASTDIQPSHTYIYEQNLLGIQSIVTLSTKGGTLVGL